MFQSEEPIDITKINDMIQNVRFVYDRDGKEIEELVVYDFKPRYDGSGEGKVTPYKNFSNTGMSTYWFNCDMMVPSDDTAYTHPVKIEFDSDYPLVNVYFYSVCAKNGGSTTSQCIIF